MDSSRGSRSVARAFSSCRASKKNTSPTSAGRRPPNGGLAEPMAARSSLRYCLRMPRVPVVALGVGVLALTAGCSLLTGLDDLSRNVDGGEPDATTMSDSGSDAVSDDAASDSGSDADAGCVCTNLVSAYRFSDPSNLGHDFLSNNNLTTVTGTPKQSTVTPNGLPGYSIELDGASSVCIASGFTFNSPADHTLCWWSQPAALANSTNQFAQECGYDTWTANSGADYLWRINNCNDGGPADLQVPSTYAIGEWVQICQTYARASLKRTVVLNGKTSSAFSVTDTAPIVMSPTASWCIGSYGGSGGFWTGRIYQPMWFDRVLSDREIQQVYAQGCCLP